MSATRSHVGESGLSAAKLQPAVTQKWLPVSQEKWQEAEARGVNLEAELRETDEPKTEKHHPKTLWEFPPARKYLVSVTCRMTKERF